MSQRGRQTWKVPESWTRVFVDKNVVFKLSKLMFCRSQIYNKLWFNYFIGFSCSKLFPYFLLHSQLNLTMLLSVIVLLFFRDENSHKTIDKVTVHCCSILMRYSLVVTNRVQCWIILLIAFPLRALISCM